MRTRHPRWALPTIAGLLVAPLAAVEPLSWSSQPPWRDQLPAAETAPGTQGDSLWHDRRQAAAWRQDYALDPDERLGRDEVVEAEDTSALGPDLDYGLGLDWERDVDARPTVENPVWDRQFDYVEDRGWHQREIAGVDHFGRN